MCVVNQLALRQAWLLVRLQPRARRPQVAGSRFSARVSGLASDLNVELQLVPFQSPGQLSDAATDDAWDIGLIGADPLREESIAFTKPYVEIAATYAVPENSSIMAAGDVDQKGNRIVVANRSGNNFRALFGSCCADACRLLRCSISALS